MSTTAGAAAPLPPRAYGERADSGEWRDGVSGRLPALDGVRALSILAVLAAHMLPLGPSQWQLNATAGPAGMSLFFTLSGFLIVRFLWADQRVVPFMIKRVSRIVPIATVYAFVLCILIAQDAAAFAKITTYTVNYLFGAPPGTGHLWSLCVEMHFYAAIALIVAAFGRRGLWSVPLLALLVTGLRIAAGADINIKTHLRVDEILAGGTLALAHIQLLQRPALLERVRQTATWAVWPVALLFVCACSPFSGPFAYLRPYLGMMTVAGCLYTNSGLIGAVLRWRVFAYIAKVSYALYIFHPATMLGWLGEGGRMELYLLKRPISFALTFALAHVSTNTLEKWFNDAGRRFVKARYPTPARPAAAS